jgi:hypothetical protein
METASDLRRLIAASKEDVINCLLDRAAGNDLNLGLYSIGLTRVGNVDEGSRKKIPIRFDKHPNGI